MTVTVSIFVFAGVLLVGMLAAYTFGWSAGKAHGKVEAYEADLGVDQDAVADDAPE